MTDKDRVNVFVFLLLRDCVPFGQLEQIVATIESLREQHTGTHRYANKNMEAYVRGLVSRLLLTPTRQQRHEKHFKAKKKHSA